MFISVRAGITHSAVPIYPHCTSRQRTLVTSVLLCDVLSVCTSIPPAFRGRIEALELTSSCKAQELSRGFTKRSISPILAQKARIAKRWKPWQQQSPRE